MPSEPIRQELVSVIREVREYVEYLDELGVEHCEEPIVQRVADTNKIAAAKLEATAAITTHQTGLLPPLPATGPVPVQATERAASTEQSTAPSLLMDTLFGELPPQKDERLPESDESFEQIWSDLGECTRCPLCQERTNIVHTDGNKSARLMFVGEAPGADEDAQARPFVGRAGQLLTKIIEAIGLKREDVLIGNVNRCRPPGNRAPTQEEASMCKPFLLREIAAARPEVIVVLGNTAMKNLLGTREGITRV
ncbi:MAG TPA: uracil-DNA glycosylase, partial [Pyrinomonadaceae bacterium]|nr:uracil-DNA glycosylase [Pyrinomonadaceae bacterium]